MPSDKAGIAPAPGEPCERRPCRDGKGMILAPGFAPACARELLLSRSARRGLHTDDEVDTWIAAQRGHARLRTHIVPLGELAQWVRDGATGNIVHRSGRFFTITGLAARHRTRSGELEWDQPVIDQPEIGILGILAKRINGVLHVCLQAKEEPGNLHSVQLSPTVQATHSNYTRVHGGSRPPFVEHFLDPPRERLLYGKLQTEDGGRFLFKSNRNMIVLASEEEVSAVPEGFIWLTLRQVAALVRRDNLVNACARSVLASLFGQARVAGQAGPFPESGENPEGAARAPMPAEPGDDRVDLAGIFQWLDDIKARNHILQRRVGLATLTDWGTNRDGSFAHHGNKYFKIVGIRVSSDGREVKSWDQPILDNVGTGIIGVLLKRVRNRTYLLMQAKAEVGNRSIVQIGPTVQFTQENYIRNDRLAKPFLFDEFMQPRRCRLVGESRQSEEGARFFREEHLHRVLLLSEDRSLDLPPEYRWLSVDEVGCLVQFGEQVNSCARSILSTLL